MNPVDMSPEAIDRRLRELSDLYDFGKELKKIRHLGPVNPEARIDFDELHRLLAIYGDQLRADSRTDAEKGALHITVDDPPT